MADVTDRAGKRLPPPVPQRAQADPDDEPIPCEVCGEVVRKGDTFSFILGWGTTGPIPVAAFACGGGHDGNGQHFTCSRACAIDAARACIDEHLTPLHEERRQRVLDNTRDPETQAKYAWHEPRYTAHPDHVGDPATDPAAARAAKQAAPPPSQS